MKKSKRKSSKSAKVRELLAKGLPVKVIAKRLKVTPALVYNIRTKQNKEYEALADSYTDNLGKSMANTASVLNDVINIRLPNSSKLSDAEIAELMVKDSSLTLEQITAQLNPDMVNHPPHYTAGKIEVIDFIEDQRLSYHLGNVIKYICRADHKGSRLEDLKKAAWYLNRAIERDNQ
jgi:hypothetical protein